MSQNPPLFLKLFGNIMQITTLKYLIGILIPHDTIRSILKGWGRHKSYQHVTESSIFLKYLIYADTVMADSWFNIASRGC